MCFYGGKEMEPSNGIYLYIFNFEISIVRSCHVTSRVHDTSTGQGPPRMGVIFTSRWHAAPAPTRPSILETALTGAHSFFIQRQSWLKLCWQSEVAWAVVAIGEGGTFQEYYYDGLVGVFRPSEQLFFSYTGNQKHQWLSILCNHTYTKVYHSAITSFTYQNISTSA